LYVQKAGLSNKGQFKDLISHSFSYLRACFLETKR